MKIVSYGSNSLPFAFVREHLSLTWSNIAWGFRHGWLDASSVVEYAIIRLAENHAVSSEEVELASLSQSELAEVPYLVDKIVGTMSDKSDSRRDWLYVILSWFYDQRREVADPLGIVERLYADFGYPDEMAPFVRYMPPDSDYEPRAHTSSENIDRLFKNWEHYLASFPKATDQ